MNHNETNIEKELKSLGYQDVKLDEARFPVITGHRKTGNYEIDVRMELTPRPTTVIRGRNGCSMKYIIPEETEGTVTKAFKALRAINDGTAFHAIWDVINQ
ncbi:MAG TPA: hypothetical protein VKM55_25985 [Candidatus Lokiarchaeia archaeon]|nr:hypothetical protein [Candidatus Lokiarchaeia archaeon]